MITRMTYTHGVLSQGGNNDLHLIKYTLSICTVLETRSTAHIGPWYEIIFLRFHMHAVLAIPLGKISATPRSFGRRSSIGENVACIVPSLISRATAFSSPLPTVSLFA